KEIPQQDVRHWSIMVTHHPNIMFTGISKAVGPNSPGSQEDSTQEPLSYFFPPTASFPPVFLTYLDEAANSQ
ncbi:Hypothetical predicted protein, partial [Podarcis lilfordi]